jgi:hypothetical protein
MSTALAFINFLNQANLEQCVEQCMEQCMEQCIDPTACNEIHNYINANKIAIGIASMPRAYQCYQIPPTLMLRSIKLSALSHSRQSDDRFIDLRL